MSRSISDRAAALPPEGGGAPLRNREIDTHGRGLRAHSTRGILINSAFQIGFAGINLSRRLLVAAFLTQVEYGLWGILLSTLITLIALKQVGIGDKYIQQSDSDQEAAYQKAFTLELGISLLFFLLAVAVLPLYAAAYGYSEMILPGIILATTVPLSVFQTPIWIAYRNMQFVRQRVLMAIDPLVAFAVTIVLGALGYGYWSLIVGALAGVILGGAVATITSPIRMRLRYDRGTLREYTRFSWPLLFGAATNLIMIQAGLLIANETLGLVAIAAIGLTTGIASFADRVDGIVSQTLYPAVAAVAHRRRLLHEAFIKSNRVVLMWAIPFSAGLALFTHDLITFVLGEQWRYAADLFIGFGLLIGATQIAFNWTMFLRAVNYTKPIFWSSILRLAVFGAVTVPAVLAIGLMGFVVGFGATVATQLILRGYFLGKLFDGFKMLRHSVRAIAPSFPAAGAILALRLVEVDRTLPVVIGEIALYTALTIAFTFLFERRLLGEMIRYLRGAVAKRPGSPEPATTPAA